MAPRATFLLAVVLVVLVVHAQCTNYVRPCKKGCPRNVDPVCGSDGITYTNLCLLENARCDNPNLRLKHKGPCQAKQCSNACPKNIKYVCGTDGITYDNLCLLEFAQCKDPSISLAYNGRCRD